MYIRSSEVEELFQNAQKIPQKGKSLTLRMRVTVAACNTQMDGSVWYLGRK